MIDLIHIYILIASILLVLLFLWVVSRLTKRNDISKFFEGHVNDSYLNKIKQNANRINVSGEEKVITVMFIDIRGFTSLSERYSNKKIFQILNHHLNNISNIIIKNYGTIDKFLGDGTMAFWGAPLFDRYQVTHALKAAFEIKKYFEKTDLSIGIGINTGTAILGRVGRESMISYTAIGDTVNLSARLESLNKLYGTAIILSESTQERLEREPKKKQLDIFMREVDKVKVYGKKKSTVLYELIDLKSTIDRKSYEGYEWFDLGLNAYRNGNWGKAEQYFRLAMKRLQNDKVCKTYIDRCRQFMISPPVGRWDGSVSLNKL